ncbi:glycosyltransferase family 2 protein [Hippea alviniae]|uniref:glycosyltransferase family 2 protein n=1 Tax=Hippea alviniae TaxID=1279027 RepID=UPI0003B6EAF9|nr:glycosyltransferase family A protein [Hippea alviniae]
MDKNEGVSIIIPTFNRKNLLLQAVESAFNQTYKPYEVIVSDDGSSDGSGELVKKYFPETVYIYHENCGRCCARNIAIEKAKYPLIAFLDDDDIWDKKFLEICVNRIKKGDVIGVFTNYFKLYPSGKKVIGYKEGKTPQIVDLKWIVRGSFIDPSTVVIKKKIVERVGGFDESLEVTEDWDLWLKVMKIGKFAYIEKPLVYKRIDICNEEIPIKTRKHNCIVIENFYNSLSNTKKKEIEDVLKQTMSKVYMKYGAALIHSGNRKIAREYLKKSLEIDNKNFKTLSRYIITFLPTPIAKALNGGHLRKFRKFFKK